ncbi:hypothetical protein DPMN_092721 [Dreissena polymorpha]|uniref:Uncharacterized protein n=1 Tax=Dreissena polymorpha TaxID=45954 RepID=A0A9D4L1W0_DREPO|nr:hypothetical protein DPMN_092721 [Dreissena polymorpha]
MDDMGNAYTERNHENVSETTLSAAEKTTSTLAGVTTTTSTQLATKEKNQKCPMLQKQIQQFSTETEPVIMAKASTAELLTFP